MRPFMRMFALSLMLLFLSGCATTTLKDTWRNPSAAIERVHKVVVVSITKKDANRHVYEEVIANELNRRGVPAVPGYVALPGDEKLDTALLQGALKKAGAQAVLTVQTVNVERQTVVHPGTYPGYWYPSAFPSWSLYGYYDAMYYEPPYVSSFDIASIQVNLFDTQSGKLVWAGTVQSSEPGKSIAVSKDIARIVAEQLAKEGLI